MVTGFLNILGVNICHTTLKVNPNNPKGSYEDRDFKEIDNVVLRSAGGDSWAPPSCKKF